MNPPASRVAILFLVAVLMFFSQTVGLLLLVPSLWRQDLIRFAQTDLIPVIVAAQLYNQGNKAAIYGHNPYVGLYHPDWVAVEEALPTERLGETDYPYAPIYLLPFTWLVRVLEYYQLVAVVAVLNLII